MIRACFPLLLPHDVKVKRIWLLCIHELLWEVGRGAWQSCWDVDFLATGGIIWALEQCAQQGCSHQHQEKAFSLSSEQGAQSFPSVTAPCTSTPGDNWNLWLMKGWWSLVWKMWPEVQSTEAFHVVPLFALEGQEQLRIQLFLYEPLCWWKSHVAAQKLLVFLSSLILFPKIRNEMKS